MKTLLLTMQRTVILILISLSLAFTWPTTPSSTPSQPTAKKNMLKFNSNDSKYNIEYPSTWQGFDRGEGVVVFKNNMQQTGYPVMINIQSIYTKKGGGKYPTIKALMDDFYSQVPKHVDNAKFTDRSPYVLTQANGVSWTGEQTYLTFVVNKHTIKQWQIMIVSPDGKIFQAFAYRAPLEYFDANKETADAMLKSWTFK